MAKRPPARLEKFEQADGVKLIQSLGGVVYVVGGKRRQTDYQGTMQTPGIPDVHFFLPPPRGTTTFDAKPVWTFWFWEAKRTGGKPRPAQAEHRRLCELSNTRHVLGDLTELMHALVDAGYLKLDQLPSGRRESYLTSV